MGGDRTALLLVACQCLDRSQLVDKNSLTPYSDATQVGASSYFYTTIRITQTAKQINNSAKTYKLSTVNFLTFFHFENKILY